MSGKLYGIGVGPGDPELLTLKAVRILKEADVLAAPGNKKEDSVAWQIAAQALPEIAEKPFLPVNMPMTKDPAALEASHEAGARRVAEVLEKGKTVAFLTLGDPCVYATYLYIHKRIRRMGCAAQIVSGVPSFCAAAAKLDTSLAEKDEMLHVIPASYPVEDALALPGTKVLMKAGRQMRQVKEALLRAHAQAVMAENCGMPEERFYFGAENIPDEAGYYSLIIVHDREPGQV